jgi:predicted transcriptional regulator
MKTVTLDVRTLADTLEDVAEAMETLTPSEPRISFETPELLWKVLTAKRWEILRTMTGAGPLATREVARRVRRDVKGVHSDVQVLLNAGLLDKTDEGKIVFPYDAVHVDFMLESVAA